jgi:hypothetical protein
MSCYVGHTHTGQLAYARAFSLAISDNGWTDNEIGMSWLKDFNSQTVAKAAGRTRYVYLDGHNSHFSCKNP